MAAVSGDKASMHVCVLIACLLGTNQDSDYLGMIFNSFLLLPKCPYLKDNYTIMIITRNPWLMGSVVPSASFLLLGINGEFGVNS